MASGMLPGGAGLPVQGTGGSGSWPTGLPARTCSPRESRETGYAGDSMPGTVCAARADPALPRVLVQEACYHVCLGSRLRCGKAVAGRRRRHDIVGKKARIRSRGAGRVHIHQDWDKRKEAVVARRGTRGRNQARQEGQDRRVRRACRGRDPADAAVRKVRRPDVREIPQGGPPEMG